jgi:hypothetical protein
LIKQLGHEEFTKREAASKELDAIGEPALDALRKAAASDGDVEIRRRAERIVQSVTGRIRAALAEKELKKLQGTWYTVSINYRGMATGENKADTITYEGNKYIQKLNGQVWAVGAILIVDCQSQANRVHRRRGRPQGLPLSLDLHP